MQSFAFLWFELQMTQPYLREKTFPGAQVPGNPPNSDAPIGFGTLRSASVEQVPEKAAKNRKLLFFLVATGVYLSMATFSLAAADDRIPVGFKTNRYSHLWEENPFTLVVPAALQAVASVHPEKTGGVLRVAEATVTVVHPEKAEAATLQLPGQLSAYTDTPIYAQTSGYLRLWSFDIGAKVKANDNLGEIDTPEVDQALAQAKAQLQVDQSALKLAQVTYQRYQRLFDQKVLDAQTRDTAADTYREDQAKVAADEANIERLNALEAFKLLRAPFDGIVTARDVDVGAYVANGSGSQLFRVARTSPLRIYLNVPQRDAQLVKIGMEADLTLPQFPNRTFRAHVTNTAEVVDPTSRSLLTQLQIANETGELLPGAYAEITLKFTDDSRFLTIPENMLLFRREGPAVGVVHPGGKVELRKITINRDFGDKLEVSEGLSTSDQVILNPSDNLTDGMSITITEPGSLQASSR